MQPDRMKQLFKPDSVVLYGASDVEGALGTVVLNNLKSAGFHGEITLINPKYEEIDGEPCYPSLAEAARDGRHTRMTGTVLKENQRMLKFVKSLGFEIEPSIEDPQLMAVTLDL